VSDSNVIKLANRAFTDSLTEILQRAACAADPGSKRRLLSSRKTYRSKTETASRGGAPGIFGTGDHDSIGPVAVRQRVCATAKLPRSARIVLAVDPAAIRAAIAEPRVLIPILY